MGELNIPPDDKPPEEVFVVVSGGRVSDWFKLPAWLHPSTPPLSHLSPLPQASFTALLSIFRNMRDVVADNLLNNSPGALVRRGPQFPSIHRGS